MFTSNYNALQLSLNHRSNKGLTVGASYTYSKVLTTSSMDRIGDLPGSYLGYAMQNSYDPRAEYGPAAFDQPQSLIFNYVYTLPFFKGQQGLEGRALGGWELSGITTIASGSPLTLVQADDPFACQTDSTGLCAAGSAPGTGLHGLGIGSSGFGSSAARLEQIAPVTKPKQIGQWFSSSSYSLVPNGHFGNVSNGSLFGPGIDKWDMALAKNTNITEHVSFQLRVEAFDVFNHANYSGVSGSIGGYTSANASFGAVTSDHEPRILQMGGKIRF
jgi:hypothetical protein